MFEWFALNLFPFLESVWGCTEVVGVCRKDFPWVFVKNTFTTPLRCYAMLHPA